MSFINNPLGSGGYSAQGLGNLTAGIEALQKTEINRRLQEIEQDKANRRSDALRNEEFALKMASTDVINDKRMAIAEQATKDAEAFMQTNADMVKRAQAEGRGLTLTEKMKLVTDQKKILQNNAQASNFTDALEKAQSIHISALKAIKDPISRAKYEKNWADLYVKMKDPIASKDLSPADIIAAIEPPEPPVSVLFQEKAKELVPFVDASVKSIGGGRTEVDRDKLMKAIRSNIPEDDYLFTKGVEEKRWSTPEEMYTQLAERVAPSIKTDVVGWKPDQMSESERNAQIIETPTFVESSDPSVKSGKGVVVKWGGKPLTVTTGTGKEATAAQFTPTQYVGKNVQGKFSGVKYVKREGVDEAQARRDKKGDSSIDITNSRMVGGKRVVDATYPEVSEWYGSVPYSQIQDEMKKKTPEIDKTYREEILSEGKKVSAPKSKNKYGI